MGIILDLVLIVIFALSIFLGYKKGLIGVVFGLCAFLISIILTFILYIPITNAVINNTDFDEKIEEFIIENGISEQTEEDGVIDGYISEAKNEIIESTARQIAEKAIFLIVAVVLFIIIRIALIFVKFFVEAIASLPIIKQANQLGGILYGILRGILIIYIILAIMFLIVSINSNSSIMTTIDSSILTKMLYSNNLILNLIF